MIRVLSRKTVDPLDAADEKSPPWLGKLVLAGAAIFFVASVLRGLGFVDAIESAFYGGFIGLGVWLAPWMAFTFIRRFARWLARHGALTPSAGHVEDVDDATAARVAARLAARR